MTKYESETITIYNDEEKTATVYTCNIALMRYIDKLVEKYPEECKVEKQDECSKTYVFPKKWCKKPKPPRTMTEEQKGKVRERLQSRIKN